MGFASVARTGDGRWTRLRRRRRARLDALLAADQSTPDQGAGGNKVLLGLAGALEQLSNAPS